MNKSVSQVLSEYDDIPDCQEKYKLEELLNNCEITRMQFFERAMPIIKEHKQI